MLKKSKPIIGIIGVPTVDDEDDSVIALYTDYKNAIIKKGCIPFVIPPVSNIDYVNIKLKDIPELTEQEKKLYEEFVDICDGIIIPGGHRMYNFAKYIAEYAIEKDIPVLGICMGMQLLAAIDNGFDCIEKNETCINHKQRTVQYVHEVNILENTLLSNIIGIKTIKVNSKHNYHIKKPNKFMVSSYSEDGLIEAIEMPNKKFVLGVQWHPEKMIDYDEYANKIFDKFIDSCKES